MSQSSRPTEAPVRASASARLTETVDLSALFETTLQAVVDSFVPY